ncbi:Galactosyltransferase N-terminal, partial [Trinorchestia longiramus]
RGLYEPPVDVRGLYEPPVDVRGLHEPPVDVRGLYEPPVDVRGTIFDYSEFEDYPPGLREKLQAVANKTRKLSQKQNYGEHSNPQEKNALNLNNQNFVPDVKEHLGSFKNRNHVIGRDFVRRKGNHLGRPIIDEFGQTLALRPDLQGQNTKENHQPATAGRRRRDNASNWLLETSTGDPGISTGHAGTGIRDTRARTGSGGTGTGGAGVGTGGAGVGTAGAGIGTGYAGIGVGDSNNLKTNGDENAIDVHKNRHGCLPSCPLTPPNLKGRQAVITAATEEQVLRVAATSGVLEGGCWSPRYCTARYTVAIIVPVRDRKEQEWAFLLHMHPFLQRQQLNYTIFIVEQTKGSLFNRAKLLNVGFLTATQTTTYDCVVFHDVDMLPEDDHHLYHCSTMPRHLVVASSNNDYR